MAPVFVTDRMQFDIGNEDDITEENYIAYCRGYHVVYSTAMNLENDSRELKKISRYLFGKCILNLSNEKL